MKIKLPVIKLGLEIGTVDINTNQISVDGATAINFICTSRIECCSTMRIPVTSFDIERITKHGYELDQILESLSPVLLPSKTPDGKTEKVYIIKRKPFSRDCTFLENKLCKIHDYKPFACRTYPFTLDIVNESKINILIHSEKLCQSISSASNFSGNKSILELMLSSIKEELILRKHSK